MRAETLTECLTHIKSSIIVIIIVVVVGTASIAMRKVDSRRHELAMVLKGILQGNSEKMVRE